MLTPPPIGTIDAYIGNTPLVRLRRLGSGNNTIYVKLEGNNVAGSVKDRPAYSMVMRAAERGDIAPGDTLVEATSGNTGIALAMVAAALGYELILIMPDDQTEERKQSMRAYGAELIGVAGGMEEARDLADTMVQQGRGFMLNQFANADNPLAHYLGTAPEIWAQTEGRVSHFVSSMGTTGTITGCSRFFKEQNPLIEIVGCYPAEGARIPGIRKWAEGYVPKIFDPTHIDQFIYIAQEDAEETMRELARREGIFAGISSGGALWAALQLDAQLRGAHIVSVVCDRGDRYLSSGVYA